MPTVTDPTAAAADTHVVRAAIHPAIGVARLGNSKTEYFLAPQVVEPAPKPVGFYRDGQGALKREAVQFRIYGYNAAGEVVRELTADDADIRWSVHVANRKAQWYQWQIALDIPEAATVSLPRRNASVTQRDTLAIDAGVQTIRGRNHQAVPCAGNFQGTPVTLGELRTDAHGRLVFLGGFGISASPTGTPIYVESDPDSFINADGWYDDTCDGPVTATVRCDGRDVPCDPAWVLSAPPNYAPQVKAERTLYDLLHDLYVQAGWCAPLASVSFTRDVYPILQRLSGLQWVNAGFATAYGHNGRYDFQNAAFVARLSAPPPPHAFDPNAELRRQVFNSYRPPEPLDGNQLPWPWLYGDAMTIPAGQSPRQNASVSQTQYDVLSRWASGDFVADWGTLPPPPAHLEQVPLREQPAMLDRAALEFCLADAFHPGCETTWPMRHLSMYRAPFRLRPRPADAPEPDYGPQLTQQIALSPHGPLNAQRPGDVTRWMGLPWQADTAYCRAGYDTHYDPYAPTFWPARVPNHVLTSADYDIVIDPRQPQARRIEAFAHRTDWTQPLHGTTSEQMEQMVRIFGSMGLVEVRPGVRDDPLFPAQMMVAAYGPDVPVQTSEPAPAVAAAKRAARLPAGANFESHEEARQAPLPVRYPRKKQE